MNYKPRNTASTCTQKGKGDSYGNAIKQKVGSIRQDMLLVPKKKLGKPPKSLA